MTGSALERLERDGIELYVDPITTLYVNDEPVHHRFAYRFQKGSLHTTYYFNEEVTPLQAATAFYGVVDSHGKQP